MNTLESGLSGENPLYLILSTLNTRKIKIIKRRKLRRGGGRGEEKKREESGYVRGKGGGKRGCSGYEGGREGKWKRGRERKSGKGRGGGRVDDGGGGWKK